MKCIIGYTGFVGSYLQYNTIFDEKYNSSNISDIRGKSFETIYCCGLPAQKWYINQHPDWDINNISSLMEHLKSVKCSKFILISTIDIYDKKNDNSTEINIPDINNYQGDYYGKHRLIFENFVKEVFPSYHIIRLCGLYGYGLRKNMIYDIIFKHAKYNPNSKYQWYNMDWLKNDIEWVISKNIKLINLFTEPIPMFKIIKALYKVKPFDSQTICDNYVEYNLKTEYNYNGYWRNKKDVINGLIRYYTNMIQDKVQISQLCFSDDMLDKSFIENFGIKKLEFVPYKEFGNDFIDKELSYFDQWRGKYYSCQSILYPQTFNIFEHKNKFIDYMFKLIKICSYIGCKILVLGSPKNRIINDNIPHNEIIELFREIGEEARKNNLIICLEPNSRSYGCNFITNIKEGSKFVSEINSEGLALMADIGNMELENEDLEELFSHLNEVKHIHFSAPHLKSITTSSNNFCYLYDRLTRSNYQYKITLEMLKQDKESIIRSLYTIFRTPEYHIIGGGWYGCYLATKLLETGHIVKIFERNPELITEASFKNQNRLHLGFHYCRSANTRRLCSKNFKKFVDNYSGLISEIKYNYYGISHQSIVDFETYLNIFRYDNIPFEIVKNPVIRIDNCEGIISVPEMYIDPRKTRYYFTKLLENYAQTNYDYTLDDIKGRKYDYLINCSYNLFAPIDMYKSIPLFYEKTIMLIYETKEQMEDFSLTIVDGNFGSLYKYVDNTFTLSSVLDTPLIKTSDPNEIDNYILTDDKLSDIRSKMEKLIVYYYPDFNHHFIYKDYILSYKCKLNSNSDTRELVDIHHGQYRHIFCGKISGIFDINL